MRKDSESRGFQSVSDWNSKQCPAEVVAGLSAADGASHCKEGSRCCAGRVVISLQCEDRRTLWGREEGDKPFCSSKSVRRCLRPRDQDPVTVLAV